MARIPSGPTAVAPVDAKVGYYSMPKSESKKPPEQPQIEGRTGEEVAEPEFKTCEKGQKSNCRLPDQIQDKNPDVGTQVTVTNFSGNRIIKR